MLNPNSPVGIMCSIDSRLFILLLHAVCLTVLLVYEQVSAQ